MRRLQRLFLSVALRRRRTGRSKRISPTQQFLTMYQMTCSLCNTYVHDVLVRPFPTNHRFHPHYNYKVLARLLPEVVTEFQRIIETHHYDTTEPPSKWRTRHLLIRLIEEGFVRKTKTPLFIGTVWVNYQVDQLIHVRQIHHDHSGGYREMPMDPLPPCILQRYAKAGYLDVTSEIE